jgi:4-hydroxybenzoate polyprenyltransferase
MNRLRAYAQLVRLPNVFTAVADIGLGVLASGVPPARWLSCALLGIASACLYCGGMVWNDYFDVDQDRRERPFRPLPSGRVTRRAAARLGSALLATGWVLALLSGWGEGRLRQSPAILAGLLVGAILLYDGWLKRTWAGPLGMGTCRFLNVLLGWTAAVEASWPWPWNVGVGLAVVVGVYIVGVTWFARTEARTSSQAALSGAAVVMLAGLFLAVPLPLLVAEARPAQPTSPLFLYLLVGLGFLVGIPVGKAVAVPTAGRVQAAVKGAVLGLVILDAVLATALVGLAGLVILVLLPPALYLGRWIYST